jgi:hypothetical protein
MHPFSEEMVDIHIYLFRCRQLQRDIHPDHILLDNVEIVFNGMLGVVAAL